MSTKDSLYDIIRLESAQEQSKVLNFLQNQLTCDLSQFNGQHCQLGAWCNHQGRIICSVYVIKHGDYYLLLPPGMADIVVPRLQKIALLSRIRLINASSEISVIGLMGNDNCSDICDHLEMPLPQSDYAVVQQKGISLVRLPSKELRLLVLIANEDLALINLQNLAQANLNAWQLADINAGIAHITPATSGLFTVHQLNYLSLQGASLNKGCYPGQEIIARTQYLGKSKQQLYRVELTTQLNPQPGEQIIDDQQKTIGNIVNICTTAENKFSALAVLFESAARQKTIKLATPHGSLQITSSN
jgi:folate-binding protein YgfZ